MIERLRSTLSEGTKKSSVLRVMLKYGLRVDERGEVYCGGLRIPYSSIAREASVDRRTVKKVVEEILSDDDLRSFFSNLEPAGPFLRKVAKLAGYRCLVIETIEDRPGIVAHVSSALAKKNINIIQIVAEDPHIYQQQKLYIITEGEVPGEVINEILSSPIIRSVTIF